MLPKASNSSIEYEDSDCDFTKEDCNTKSLNSIGFYPADFKFLNRNDLKINYNISLNNNLTPPPLLIDNLSREKEYEQLYELMKVKNNDNKHNSNDFLPIEHNKKTHIFITKRISLKKESINNLLKRNIKFGRKKKDDITKGGHNKYSDDNLRRKCKHLVLKSFIDFINEKIEILYKGNIGNSIFKKKFLTFKKTQKAESSIPYNKIFLTKTLKDICSDTISSKFTSYTVDHNKNLI